jgi:CheY-like chemotaxis protein
MPVMNGWTFRAEQQQDPDLATIPVVLLSGQPDLRAIAEQLAAAGALTKPVFVPDLLRVIAAFFP